MRRHQSHTLRPRSDPRGRVAAWAAILTMVALFGYLVSRPPTPVRWSPNARHAEIERRLDRAVNGHGPEPETPPLIQPPRNSAASPPEPMPHSPLRIEER